MGIRQFQPLGFWTLGYFGLQKSQIIMSRICSGKTGFVTQLCLAQMLGSILGIRRAKVENEAQEFVPRKIGRASVMVVFVLNHCQISQSTYFSKN